MTQEIDLPDGSIGEFPDGMPDEQIQAVLRKQFGGGPVATAVPTPSRTPGGLPTPIDVLGKVLPYALSPVKKAFDVAGQADVAAGIKTPAQATSRAQTYTNMLPPLLTGLLTGGGSLPVQAAAQMATTHAMQEGGMEAKKPLGPIDTSVAISGAMPYAGALIGRLGRGVGRTMTRLLPGRFNAAQQAAQEGAAQVAEQVRPETAAGNLFRGARAAGGDVIPASNIQRVVTDLGESIGESPQNPGLQTVKAYADKLGAAAATGTVDLKTLMQMRLDLGRSLGKAPEVGALYGAVLSDLEAAAQGGGTGAQQALAALQAFKQDLGAQKFTQMVQQATKASIAGGTGLNMATLQKSIRAVPKGQTEPELLRLLGPEKFQQVLAYVDKFRALPPAMAYTLGNMGLGGLAGITGALSGVGTVPAIIAGEVGKNAAMAGHNPAVLNQILGTAASMGRAGAAAPAEPMPVPATPPLWQRLLRPRMANVP